MASGKQIKFTVSWEAVAYLRWFAKTILFEGTEDDAARHLMMKQLEKVCGSKLNHGVKKFSYSGQ